MRGRKPTKFGKIKSFYLSNESRIKLDKLSPNKQSDFIEYLILKEWRIRNAQEENRDISEKDN